MAPAPSRLPFLMADVLAAGLLAIGIGGIVAPRLSAHGFGIPLADGADAMFVRAMAARDVAIGLTIIGLRVIRNRTALGVAIAAGTLIPLSDLIQVLTHAQGSALYAAVVHGGGALFMAGAAALLLRNRR